VGYDAASIVRQVRQTFVERPASAEIIVGSIQQMVDINAALQAGADIGAPEVPSVDVQPSEDRRGRAATDAVCSN
jgi:hypothetical protein